MLLAYCHVAHNCRIGSNVTMSSTAQLAGHVEIDDFATVGGMVGMHQFVRVGRYAMIGGASKVARDVPPFFLADGNPPQVYGLNTVGLRRADFDSETIAELKECYKLMYRSGRSLSQATEAIRALVKSDAGRALLAFIEKPSERGILK